MWAVIIVGELGVSRLPSKNILVIYCLKLENIKSSVRVGQAGML